MFIVAAVLSLAGACGLASVRNGISTEDPKLVVMRIAFTALMLLGVPGTLLACPVCFGQNDSPLASAMNLGILRCSASRSDHWSAFATFIIHLMKRARLAESEWAQPANPDGSGGRRTLRAGRHGGVA